MTEKLELKSCHEVIDTVDVANIESIFYGGKPTDPDILTVVMKGGKRLYCDEVCPIDSLQEEPVSGNIDFEKELYKAFGQVKDFTLGMRIAKWFYDMGKNSQWLVSKDLEEAAREAATWHSRNGGHRFFPNDYQKFIAGAMWQKRHDNIPQELVENYCEFIKEGGKNVCALINAVNACNAKKAECISKDLEEAASQYSFNIPSAIFNDLTPVLQNIWKREIEGAFIAGAKWYKEQLKDKGE